MHALACRCDMHHLIEVCVLSQDVKTYTAFCLAHILRLHTADCPYSAAQQQVRGIMYVDGPLKLL